VSRVAASVRDVASLAGVSVGTVSNVLNRPERVSLDTAARVYDAIERLGFVRNDVARQLRLGRSRSIGLVVLDLRDPFFTDLARGVEQRAAEDGHTVLLANSGDDSEREAAHLDMFGEQRVRGVIISPLADALPRLTRLRAHGIPTVLVDPRTDDADFSSVSVDDVAGGCMAVTHLAEIGRHRIAFVGGPATGRQVADRLAGARAAVARFPGVTLEVITTRRLTVLDGRAAGELVRDRAPAERPDAIFAANDLLAVGALQALMMAGSMRVPEDIALIGYGDIEVASATVVPLSSMRRPSEVVGYRTLDLLLGEALDGAAAGHEQVVFQPELVVRGSTVPGR